MKRAFVARLICLLMTPSICMADSRFGSFDEYMNIGWPLSLERAVSQGSPQLKQILRNRKSYVFYLSIAPKTALDFRSPSFLKASVQSLIQSPSKMNGGHMMIGWKCLVDGEIKAGSAAISGEVKGQSDALMSAGWGMNSLLATFNDGYLQNSATIESILSNVGTESKLDISFAIHEVSPDDCQSGVRFVSEFYESWKDKGYLSFGSLPDPKRIEGAGCVSFGTTFLETANAFRDAIPYLSREIAVSDRLLGNGRVSFVNQPTDSSDVPIPDVVIQERLAPREIRSLSLIELLNTDWTIAPGDRVLRFRQVDPELLYLFGQEIAQATASRAQRLGAPYSSSVESQVASRRMVYGLNYEAGSNFFQPVRIEVGYDDRYGGNSKNLRRVANAVLRRSDIQVSLERFNKRQIIFIQTK